MSKLKIAIDRIHNFFNTTHAWIADGGKPVPVEEAIERSKICAGCEFNDPASGGRCPECFARKAVLFLFGWREGSGSNMRFHKEMIPVSKNPENFSLTYCAKCKCDLRLKVFIPLGVLENRGIEYPPHCWQNENRTEQPQVKEPDDSTKTLVDFMQFPQEG